MAARTIKMNHPRTIAASTPGGVARQFRVQYQVAGEANWRLFSTFRHQESANSCLEDLTNRGLIARLVPHRLVPVAA